MPPISWLDRGTRGLQPGGHVHKEAVHLLSLQPASITSSGAFKHECNGLIREDAGVFVMTMMMMMMMMCNDLMCT